MPCDFGFTRTGKCGEQLDIYSQPYLEEDFRALQEPTRAPKLRYFYSPSPYSPTTYLSPYVPSKFTASKFLENRYKPDNSSPFCPSSAFNPVDEYSSVYTESPGFSPTNSFKREDQDQYPDLDDQSPRTVLSENGGKCWYALNYLCSFFPDVTNNKTVCNEALFSSTGPPPDLKGCLKKEKKEYLDFAPTLVNADDRVSQAHHCNTTNMDMNECRQTDEANECDQQTENDKSNKNSACGTKLMSRLRNMKIRKTKVVRKRNQSKCKDDEEEEEEEEEDDEDEYEDCEEDPKKSWFPLKMLESLTKPGPCRHPVTRDVVLSREVGQTNDCYSKMYPLKSNRSEIIDTNIVRGAMCYQSAPPPRVIKSEPSVRNMSSTNMSDDCSSSEITSCTPLASCNSLASRKKYMKELKKKQSSKKLKSKKTCKSKEKLKKTLDKCKDDDQYFLLSLLPSFKKVDYDRKMVLRCKVQELICRETVRASKDGISTENANSDSVSELSEDSCVTKISKEPPKIEPCKVPPSTPPPRKIPPSRSPPPRCVPPRGPAPERNPPAQMKGCKVRVSPSQSTITKTIIVKHESYNQPVPQSWCSPTKKQLERLSKNPRNDKIRSKYKQRDDCHRHSSKDRDRESSRTRECEPRSRGYSSHNQEHTRKVQGHASRDHERSHKVQRRTSGGHEYTARNHECTHQNHPNTPSSTSVSEYCTPELMHTCSLGRVDSSKSH